MFWEDPVALHYALVGGAALLAALWLASRIRRGERERERRDPDRKRDGDGP